MNKKFKIICISIITLMLTTSLVVSFTYAWIQFYPAYNDLILTTGDYPLYIKTDIYTPRKPDPKVANDPNSINGLSTVTSEYNYKNVTNDKKTETNGTQTEDPKSGTITFKFTNLDRVILGHDSKTNSKADINELVDPNSSYGVKVDKFFIAFIEYRFIKENFTAYLRGGYKVTIGDPDLPKTNFETWLLNDQTRVDDFVKIVFIDESTPTSNTAEGKRVRKLDNKVAENTADPITSTTIEELTNLNSPKLHTVKNNTQLSFFGYEDPAKTQPKSVRVDANENKGTNGEPCYAHNSCASFFVNPGTIMTYLRSNEKDVNEQVKFTITLECSFEISDTDFIDGGNA